MSDDKQNEVLDAYEQLKRRNRRRLVVASGLVAASCLVLAVAIGSGPSDSDEIQLPAEKARNLEMEAASVAQAPVLEPVSDDEAATAAKADKPQDLAGNDSAPSDSAKENTPPEDIGAPLVLVNDRLEDDNIKGLEPVKPQPEPARKAVEKPAQPRTETAQAETPKAAKPQKTEQRAESKPKETVKTAKASETKPKETKDNTAKAKTKAADSAEKAKADVKKAEAKKPAKEAADDKKHETAKADKAEKTKTAEKSGDKHKAEAKTEAKADSKSGKKAAIQAGYAEKERALSLQRKMKAAGINSTITEIMTDKGKVYRVKSSGYKSAMEAERDLNKLRVHGIAGQVTNE